MEALSIRLCKGEKMERFKFMQNSECEYFPCHKTESEQEFNCMFCYCPLYALKDSCGGNFKYNEKGIKDCSDCSLPHGKQGYEHVMEHIRDVIELGKLQKTEENKEERKKCGDIQENNHQESGKVKAVVVRIEEPDFGCEGIGEDTIVMDKVKIQIEGEKEIRETQAEDAWLYLQGINEGDKILIKRDSLEIMGKEEE